MFIFSRIVRLPSLWSSELTLLILRQSVSNILLSQITSQIDSTWSWSFAHLELHKRLPVPQIRTLWNTYTLTVYCQVKRHLCKSFSSLSDRDPPVEQSWKCLHYHQWICDRCLSFQYSRIWAIECSHGQINSRWLNSHCSKREQRCTRG